MFCIVFGYGKFYLRQAGLSKVEQKAISDCMESVLWSLRCSVEKHIIDGDVECLRWRIA